jgi:hypothetical protein
MVDSIYHARELGKDTVTGCVNDAAAVLTDHGQDHGLVRLEIADSRFVISAHESAVASDVCGKDGGQLTGYLRFFGAVCHSPHVQGSVAATLAQCGSLLAFLSL